MGVVSIKRKRRTFLISLEKIWEKKNGASAEEIEKLEAWLEKNGFPSQNLPQEYILFLRESNGGVFTHGEREYQFFAAEEVAEMYEAYSFQSYMPNAFPFALDGNGNFYLFDMRKENEAVYAASSSNMGWGADECYPVAESFAACLQQRETLDELMM